MLLSTRGDMLPAGDVHASMMLDDDVFNSPPSAATRRRWLAAARIAAGSSPPPPPVDLGSSWMRPRAGSSVAGLHASTSPPQMTLRDIRKVAPDKTHVPVIATQMTLRDIRKVAPDKTHVPLIAAYADDATGHPQGSARQGPRAANSRVTSLLCCTKGADMPSVL